MATRNIKQLRIRLEKTRKRFYRTSAPVLDTFDKAFELYTSFSKILDWSKPGDNEIYTIEIVATAVRRIVSSFVLIESGLFQEAQMVLRNALELLLIAIDISHNSDSLNEWKKTAKEDPIESEHKDWYFSKAKVLARIKDNELYPELEREFANYIAEQWKIISNMTLHAHSYSQIKPLVLNGGTFSLLELKDQNGYAHDFCQFRALIFNGIGLLMGLPRFQKFFNSSGGRTDVKEFLAKYKDLHRKSVSNKEELKDFLLKNGLPAYTDSIPENVKIQGVEIDSTSPSNPKVIVTYCKLD